MGLDTTHDCWSGAYSSFHRFRKAVAKAALDVDLDKMAGFERVDYHNGTIANPGIPWDLYAGDPIITLLNHSDCDGSIAWKDTKALAERLRGLDVPCWEEYVDRFATGLEEAYEQREDVEFC